MRFYESLLIRFILYYMDQETQFIAPLPPKYEFESEAPRFEAIHAYVAVAYFIALLLLFVAVKWLVYESYTMRLISLLIGSLVLFDIFHFLKRKL